MRATPEAAMMSANVRELQIVTCTYDKPDVAGAQVRMVSISFTTSLISLYNKMLLESLTS